MISQKLKNIFAISIPIFIIHGLEEYFTGLYAVDPFYQLFSNPKLIFVIIVLIFLNIILVISYILIQKNKWTLGLFVLFELLLVYELTHIYMAVKVGGYYPGFITALIFPVITVFVGKELIKIIKIKINQN